MLSIPWQIWIGGLICTALSFFALGQYDDLAHRQLGTGMSQNHSRVSGMTAIALAQTIGFGMLTGAVCRWRMLPTLGASRALALSAFVSLSFIMALVVLTALACLVLPAPRGAIIPAMVVTCAVPLFVFALVRFPRFRLGKNDIKLPSITITAGIFKWTLVDTLGAAAALWLFLPPEIDMSLVHFFPIYLIALLSALLCNTPGGVGPFELVLLGVFPHVGADSLMQSIISFRLVYYALPACIGMVMLLFPLKGGQRTALPDAKFHTIENAQRSEVGVIRQNGGRLVTFKDGAAAFWSTPQTVSALFSPLYGTMPATLQAVQNEAWQSGKIPMIYKCTAREATAVREAGWAVVHVADDALLCPRTFTLDVPERRSLRRKLRAAEKGGVVAQKETQLPLKEMREIDAEWRAMRGPARGGTLGQFCEEYVSEQWVAIARLNGKPIAFITLFTNQQEWCVDLMRQGHNVPNGTMHALIHCAVLAARAEGVAQFSLAAVPPDRAAKTTVLHHLHGYVLRKAATPGLIQFKSSFAPQWTPRYAASVNRIGLALGLVDIAVEVHGRRRNDAP
ncbi:phosphatidylglycerol lysyltransferase domain-containing protein [Sulfitobacter donghicola]|nr:phosphatidylglycerol lysyltransferase domain-containing protein [Sulfitobacter donghicola]